MLRQRPALLQLVGQTDGGQRAEEGEPEDVGDRRGPHQVRVVEARDPGRSAGADVLGRLVRRQTRDVDDLAETPQHPGGAPGHGARVGEHPGQPAGVPGALGEQQRRVLGVQTAVGDRHERQRSGCRR